MPISLRASILAASLSPCASLPTISAVGPVQSAADEFGSPDRPHPFSPGRRLQLDR